MEEKERYQLERPNGTFSEIHDTKLDVWYSNRQPLEIVEKIKKELEMNGDSYCEIRKCNSSHTNHQYAWFNYVAFEEFLITMLKEYQKEVK